ncbi:MAG: metallophosphoesterase family protein [Polyangiales bacterium]
MTARAELGGPTLALRDGVVLVAPGAAFLPAESTLVVADTHAGLPSELRARGRAVPLGDDDELYARVRSMLEHTGAQTLIVAGDLVHGPGSQRASAIELFAREMAHVRLRIVRGNHDRSIEAQLDALSIEHDTVLRAGPHVVTHGDDAALVRALREEAIARGGRVLIGHVHPALALDDNEGARRVCPAFVSARSLLFLPALSVWARGGDVRSRVVRAQLDERAGDDPLGVAVVVGERVLPIGLLRDGVR